MAGPVVPGTPSAVAVEHGEPVSGELLRELSQARILDTRPAMGRRDGGREPAASPTPTS
jgi:hypothetical protein